MVSPEISRALHRRVVALPPRPRPWRREYLLAGFALMLLAVAVFAPPVAQPLHYHDFADQRLWGGLPHALDVLSNLPFALWGLLGAAVLVRAMAARLLSVSEAALAALFFVGLLVTAGVSSAYHVHPDDARLAWDRGGMVLAFAGLLGLGGLQAVSVRAGLMLAAAMLVLGPVAVQVWAVSGNVLPWAVLQLSGMVLIGVFAALRAPVAGRLCRIRWLLVILIYGVAKVLELGDHVIFEWTGHALSGHSLKHVVASFAAWPVVAALLETRKFRAESSAQR
ncbi:MAG: hypothetical protein JWR60_3465 [Polaromonas sp.]|nr:hypothetical protein [Polaromonas sp.]